MIAGDRIKRKYKKRCYGEGKDRGDLPNYLSEPGHEEDCLWDGDNEFSQEALRPIKDYKIACILDEFSYECLKYEAVFIQLDPETWEKTLSRERVDLLFVESAWKGKDSKWRKKVGNLLNSKDKTLKTIINWCKDYTIPTVFWNKEDPPNFDYFIETAKLFDYVFTSDINCLPRYREILGHENIYPLLFAAQPRLHNPINKDEDKLGQVAFAGTWYKYKYEFRREYLDILLIPALDYDLHIYNRKPGENDYEFPDIYKPYIKGFIPYEKMISTYKKYDVFLNVNSVADSPTMFSRRVFELLACGIPVLSSYSAGIEQLFPGLVNLCRTKGDTVMCLQELLESKESRDKLALSGQRAVFNNHTYRHRMETIFDLVGLKYQQEESPGVSVITITNGFDNAEQILDNFLRQNYLKEELIIILNTNNINLITNWEERCQQYDNIKIFKLAEQISLGNCLNFGVEKAGFPYIAKFDENSYYGPNFLIDLACAFDYSEAEIVGKCTYYSYMEGSEKLVLRGANMENRYVKYLHGSAMLIKKEVFDRVKYINKSSGIDIVFLKQCFKNGIKIYSTNRFNYLCNRYMPLYKNQWKINGINYQNDIYYTSKPTEYINI